MESIIVGIKKGTTKTGKPCFNYFGVKRFSDYDLEVSECYGHDVVSVFSYKDYGVEVGDQVDIQYEPGYQGKASLSNIVLVKAGAGIPFVDSGKKEEKAASK